MSKRFEPKMPNVKLPNSPFGDIGTFKERGTQPVSEPKYTVDERNDVGVF